MAILEQVNILKKGSEFWNKWRSKNDEVEIDLRGAKLDFLNLRFVNLGYCDLRNASFMDCDLMRSNLRHSNLSNANFTSANLSYSNLSYAKLDYSNLVESILDQVNFSHASFINTLLRKTQLQYSLFSHSIFLDTICDNTYFTGSVFENCVFANIDLSNCVGLEVCDHSGPSTIGVDTLYKSKGKIPINFLRGIGILEEFLDYIPSLTNQPFQFYTCFISHSAKNKVFCERLYNDLQGKGIRCWYFPEDAKWGKSVWSEIDTSIKIYDKLMVVCSESSLSSGPVLREIERALKKEDSANTHIVFPITIDNFVFSKWEHERKSDILNKVVGDFIGWDSDIEKYNKSLNKLIESLKTE